MWLKLSEIWSDIFDRLVYGQSYSKTYTSYVVLTWTKPRTIYPIRIVPEFRKISHWIWHDLSHVISVAILLCSTPRISLRMNENFGRTRLRKQCSNNPNWDLKACACDIKGTCKSKLRVLWLQLRNRSGSIIPGLFQPLITVPAHLPRIWWYRFHGWSWLYC